VFQLLKVRLPGAKIGEVGLQLGLVPGQLLDVRHIEANVLGREGFPLRLDGSERF
jgi:hypothetical protein